MLARRETGVEREHDRRREKRHGSDRGRKSVDVCIAWGIARYQVGVASATERCRHPQSGIGRADMPLTSTSGIAHFFTAPRRGTDPRLARRWSGTARLGGAGGAIAGGGNGREQRRSRGPEPRRAANRRPGGSRPGGWTERLSHV